MFICIHIFTARLFCLACLAIYLYMCLLASYIRSYMLENVYHGKLLHLDLCILGASLNKCTFNGQQCCKQFIIDLFDEAIRIAINNGSLHFTAGFTKAQKAVDKMRNDTNGTVTYNV